MLVPNTFVVTKCTHGTTVNPSHFSSPGVNNLFFFYRRIFLIICEIVTKTNGTRIRESEIGKKSTKKTPIETKTSSHLNGVAPQRFRFFFFSFRFRAWPINGVWPAKYVFVEPWKGIFIDFYFILFYNVYKERKKKVIFFAN